MITQSAGIAIIRDQSILLVHPTRAAWFGTYSIPKGIADDGEDLLTAAIRELKEETGITVSKEDIADPEQKLVINYDRNGKVYKQLTVFFLFMNDEMKQRLHIPDKIPKENLQLNEVDWAGFVTFTQAKKRIMPRLLPLLKGPPPK